MKLTTFAPVCIIDPTIPPTPPKRYPATLMIGASLFTNFPIEVLSNHLFAALSFFPIQVLLKKLSDVYLTQFETNLIPLPMKVLSIT